jgi:hypothetical protein
VIEIGPPVTLVDRIRIWWNKKLESDSVREFVPRYNFAWLTWAVLATFWLPAVPTISQAMGEPAYWIWTWTAIAANGLPLIGLRMRVGGTSFQDMSTRLLLRDWWGLYFQAIGHALACGLMLMFEVSGVITVMTYEGENAYAGLTVLAMFLFWPWCEGTFLLCAQCLRKVERGKQLEKTGGIL